MTLEKLKVLQMSGVTLLVLAIGAQVWKQPGDEHTHPDRKGSDQPLNWFFNAAQTTGKQVSLEGKIRTTARLLPATLSVN